MTSSAVVAAAGVAALACAALVLARRGHRGDAGTGLRLILAAGPALWGGGHLWSAVRGTPPVPGESWWSLAVGTLTVVAVWSVRRRTPEPLERLRMAAEGVVIASALGVPVWNLLALEDGRESPGQRALLLLITVFLSVNLMAAARHLDTGTALGLAGALLYAGGVVLGVAEPRLASTAAAVGAAGWLSMTAGTLFPPEPATRRSRRSGESGPRMLSITLPLALIVVSVGALSAAGRAIDRVTVGLGICFVLALWVREMIFAVQQQRLLTQLESLADTDPMTGLGNRRALGPALAEAYGPPHRPVSVMTLDLDGFKDVNTVLGHHTGDALLVAVARHLRERCAPRGARPFRLGGDEFAVLVEEPPGAAERLAGDLLASVPAVTARVPGVNRVAVSVSVGIAHRTGAPDVTGCAGQAGDPELFGLGELARSGEAMRAAKENGKARYLVHDAPMARRRNRRAAVERRLRVRLAEGGLDLHHQPIIHLPGMRMTGYESLARWTDEELGPVSPAEFVPVAEDSGLIVDLGLQLMRRAIETAVSTGAYRAGLATGVNVSALQLRSSGFVSEVAALLDEYAVRPDRFVLEVTESAQIDTDDTAAAAITRLAALGLVVALDDFGTGYSSLGYLTELPVRVLKLDKSLVHRLSEPRGQAVARAVSEMSRSMGIDVVAEGIETPEQLAAVQRLGVSFGQGWLFAAALPAEQFAELVRRPELALGEARGIVPDQAE